MILLFLPLLILSGCQKDEGEEAREETEQTEEISTEEEAALPSFAYAFDPHVISDEYRIIYGKSIEDAFFGLCDAVLNAEESFPCSSEMLMHQLFSISRTCLPITSALISYDDSYVSSGKAHLVYKMDHEDALTEIDAFKAKVTSVITSAIPYEAPDFIKAIQLFSAVEEKDEFDDEYSLDDFMKVRPYRAIMEDIGICQEISGEYIYYLLQVGINAFPCSALSRDQSEAHEWTMVELDGKHYHMDPTFAISYPGSLFFFGMNDLQREYYGDFPPENFDYADSDRLDPADYRADDNRFIDLWLAESYEIDPKEKIITIHEINTGATKKISYE